VARVLVDTGAVVALVNRGDRHHAAAVEWFQRFRGQLLTTEAVITETAYVLAASPAHQRAALVWFERARGAGLLAVEPVADYAALARIIAQYASLPCDYADASLIALAERTGVAAIATVDQRDFSVYRVRGRRRFKILLGAA
jgi:predicted nucleic acid-binding protein